MSTFDDELSEMSFGNDSEALGGTTASGEAAVVTQFLTDLRALGQRPAPTPSAELVALFEGAESLAAHRRHRGSGRIVRSLALPAAAIVVVTTALAASHSLPAPAQRVVSNVVNTITPFHIDPVRAPDRPPKPTLSPAPASTVPSHLPAPPPTRSPEKTRDDTGSGGEDGSNGAAGGEDGNNGAAGGDDGSNGAAGGEDGNGAGGNDDRSGAPASPTKVRTHQSEPDDNEQHSTIRNAKPTRHDDDRGHDG